MHAASTNKVHTCHSMCHATCDARACAVLSLLRNSRFFCSHFRFGMWKQVTVEVLGSCSIAFMSLAHTVHGGRAWHAGNHSLQTAATVTDKLTTHKPVKVRRAHAEPR